MALARSRMNLGTPSGASLEGCTSDRGPPFHTQAHSEGSLRESSRVFQSLVERKER